MRVVVSEAPAPIPVGCTCAYTWSAFARRQVRNGARPDCAADHTAVDKVGATEFAEGGLLYDEGGRLPSGVVMASAEELGVALIPGSAALEPRRGGVEAVYRP